MVLEKKNKFINNINYVHFKITFNVVSLKILLRYNLTLERFIGVFEKFDGSIGANIR